MNIRTHIRRPRASTVIASLALFVALGGSATAATLITGAKVKNGTLTGKDLKRSSLTGTQVKNGSLTASDLSKRSLGSLKGATGATGATGAAGAKGAPGSQGVQGPRGIVKPLSTSTASKNIAGGGADTEVLELAAPAGKYLVTAKATLASPDVDLLDCRLQNNGAQVDQTQWDAPAASLFAPVSMTGVTTVTTGSLRIVCAKSTAPVGSASDVKLIAVPIS
ncbi:MAG TPA: hypothetical protein VEX39_01380 [Thermoleophilaceae bacterium]|nr:hypothetical protein [Thermoleophilaceae bacterium]